MSTRSDECYRRVMFDWIGMDVKLSILRYLLLQSYRPEIVGLFAPCSLFVVLI